MLFTKDRMRFFFDPNERESNDPLAARPFFLELKNIDDVFFFFGKKKQL